MVCPCSTHPCRAAQELAGPPMYVPLACLQCMCLTFIVDLFHHPQPLQGCSGVNPPMYVPPLCLDVCACGLRFTLMVPSPHPPCRAARESALRSGHEERLRSLSEALAQKDATISALQQAAAAEQDEQRQVCLRKLERAAPALPHHRVWTTAQPWRPGMAFRTIYASRSDTPCQALS
jgi:hypothetical protein